MEQLLDAKADFVARGSRSMLLFTIVVLFAACGFCLWSLGAFDPIPFADFPQDNLEAAITAVGSVLFGVGGLLLLVQTFQPPIELRIGSQGVYWSDWTDKVIPWSEITRVAVRDRHQSRWFVLQLRDQSPYRSRYPQGPWRRMIARIHRPLFKGKMWISMTPFDRRYDEALLAFKTFSPTGVVFEVPWLKPNGDRI